MNAKRPPSPLWRAAAPLLLAAALPAAAANIHWKASFGGSEESPVDVMLALEDVGIAVYDRPDGMEPGFADGYRLLGEIAAELAGHSEVIYARALYAKEAGLIEESEKLYRELLGREPANPAALNGLGYLLAELPGRQDEALELLERAESIEPDWFEIIDSIAWALYRRGDLEEAADRVDEALEMLDEDSYSGEVYAHAGAIRWAMGLEEEAAEIWLEGWRNTYGLSRELRLTMERHGQEPPALDWESLDARDDPHERALLTAEYLAEDEGPEAAYAYLSAFGALHELSGELLELMADLAYDAGMLDEAAAHYRALIELDPEDPWAYNSLGYLLADSGRDIPAALELLRQGLEIDPENPYLLDSYGWALYRSGDLEGALAAVASALASEDLELESYAGVEAIAHHGEILWEMGRREEALEVWRRGWEIADHHPVLIETLHRYGEQQ